MDIVKWGGGLCVLAGRDWCGDKVLCTGCVQEFTGGLSSSGHCARVAHWGLSFLF